MEQVQQQEKKHGVWFANLSAYNGGRMVGGWLYPLAYDSFEAFAVAIKEVTRNADEVAVHDYDDFMNLGEYPDHQGLYNLMHEMNDSHIDNEILIKYYNHIGNYTGSCPDVVGEAEESFISVYDNWKDFANERAEEDIENTVNKEAVQFVFNNFDYEGYAHDLKHSYYSVELSDYSVAIFYNS